MTTIIDRLTEYYGAEELIEKILAILPEKEAESIIGTIEMEMLEDEAYYGEEDDSDREYEAWKDRQMED